MGYWPWRGRHIPLRLVFSSAHVAITIRVIKQCTRIPSLCCINQVVTGTTRFLICIGKAINLFQARKSITVKSSTR